jgi:hypothetical protein
LQYPIIISGVCFVIGALYLSNKAPQHTSSHP